MKRIIFLSGLVVLGCWAGETKVEGESFRDGSSALCFDEKQVISLSKFQKLDMLSAFEAVCEMAESEGTVSSLPQGFINCLAILRTGDDHVNCCDFIISMKLVFKLLMTMRAPEQEKCESNSRWLRDDLDELAQDVLQEFWDVWRRLDRLEEQVGLAYFD